MIRSAKYVRQTFVDRYLTDVSQIHCKLENCLVDNCICTNSKLDNCSLGANSVLTESTLTRCTIIKGAINNSKLAICKATDASFRVCMAVDSILQKSAINGGAVDLCTVDTAKLTSVDTNRSSLRRCSLDTNTKILTSNVDNCQIIKAQDALPPIFKQPMEHRDLGIRKLPPELRVMILGYAMGRDSKNGCAVVAALRGEPELYFEALEVLNRTCVLRITSRTHLFTGSIGTRHIHKTLSLAAKHSIGHISIE